MPLAWTDELMVHDWPECGPGKVSVEELYQRFKKRYDEEKFQCQCGAAKTVISLCKFCDNDD